MTTTTPDYHAHEEFQLRTKKLAELKQLGLEPYPHKYTPTHSAKGLHDTYDAAEVGHSEDGAAKTTPVAIVAGRLVPSAPWGKTPSDTSRTTQAVSK